MKVWRQYKVIEKRGFIYYIKGNIRIQITTDDKIYFYLIDKETLMPHLENVMYNYMGCNQCMFGSKVRYAVTYKTNQRAFDIYRRKANHDFKVPITEENLEGSMGLELETMGTYLVTKIDQVIMYDSRTFKEVSKIPIALLKTETREPNQVIAMQKCQDEEYLAIISGKILIMNEQKTNQLFIFKRVKSNGEIDKFEQINRIVVKEMDIFEKVCMNYHFKAGSKGNKEKDTIIFCKQTEIFEMNFMTSECMTRYKFTGGGLKRQPLFFVPNMEQDIFLIASPEDGMHLNLQGYKSAEPDKNREVDINTNMKTASV